MAAQLSIVNPEFSDRAAPVAIEAEQSVLGSLMLSPESYVGISNVISCDDFYRNDHRLIYQAIQDLHEAGSPVDVVTIGEKIDSAGLSEQVGNGAYIIELARTTPSAANAISYAEIIRDKAVLRKMIDIGSEIISKASSQDGFSADDIYAESIAALSTIGDRVAKTENDPLDLFGDQVPPSLKPEYLPPVISRFAFDQAEVKGTAPEIIAMTCLSAAAAAIHDGFVIIPKPDEPRWQERACLWTMIVADPGSKKTPGMSAALGVLRGIDDDMSRKYAHDFRGFLDDERIHKLTQKEIDKRKAKAAAGETVGLDEENAKAPAKPNQERIFISDATIEKVAELCMDNPRGLCLYRDELSGWFGSMDAYTKGGQTKDRPKWLEAYNGGSMTVDRIGRGTQYIENWSIGVIGSIQQDKIKALIHKSQDDGLFQRFMIIDVPNGYRPAQERPEDSVARDSYEQTISNLWRRIPSDLEGRKIYLDPQADLIRRQFFQWVERVSSTAGLPTMLRGHLSKWSGLWSRLVLTYHCFGCAAGGKWPGSVKVTAGTAQRVTNLMQKYLLPQAMVFYTDTVAGADPIYSSARAAASMILASGMARLSSRDMQHHDKKWREAQEWQRNAVISLLVEAGWLLGADTKRRRGNCETGWAVNPRVHVLYANRARIEAERKAGIAQGLRELREAARQH